MKKNLSKKIRKKICLKCSSNATIEQENALLDFLGP